ncbi:hypothetical protein GEMRC1_004330 [Eukaryota sp. GEM-RC1]
MKLVHLSAFLVSVYVHNVLLTQCQGSKTEDRSKTPISPPAPSSEFSFNAACRLVQPQMVNLSNKRFYALDLTGCHTGDVTGGFNNVQECLAVKQQAEVLPTTVQITWLKLNKNSIRSLHPLVESGLLACFPNLESLSLDRNQITSPADLCLPLPLPKLSFLSVKGNPLSSSVIPLVQSLKLKVRVFEDRGLKRKKFRIFKYSKKNQEVFESEETKTKVYQILKFWHEWFNTRNLESIYKYFYAQNGQVNVTLKNLNNQQFFKVFTSITYPTAPATFFTIIYYH